MAKINQNFTISPLRKIWNSTFLTSCLLCLTIGISHTALAEYKQPPNTKDDAPDSRTTTISGVRGTGGCSGKETTNLTALGPYSHIGATAATHPTFVWYVPDRDVYPVEFQIYEYEAASVDGKRELVFEAELESSPGIMSYTLPQEREGLSQENKYVWQVAVVCNPNRPSESLVVSTQIKVVDMPANLISQLNSVSDPVAKADIYAEAGLWYDALAEVATAQNNPQAREYMAQTLVQLAEMEQEKNADNIENQTKFIRTVDRHQQQLEQVVEALAANNNQ
ncbi:DUF928 domain-containing protein [Myxosarcina sp. GI1(2024)]